MILILSAALLIMPPKPPSDTVPIAGRAADVVDAYLDTRAEGMVRAARARRSDEEGSIERYTNLSRSRVSIAFSTARRERLLYRCESAVRVDWRRAGTTRLEILGAREVVPVVSAKVKPEDSDCAGAVFDPSEDRLALATGGLIRSDSGFVRHPLGGGSEADYRFRSGEVTSLRLADGRVIRLHELQVLPRRSDARLVSGSLWLEEETSAVVRAVLRLARPYDLSIDGDAGDIDDVPRLFRPIRADLRFLTIEYGLWEGRWWLPRLIAYEGEAQAGALLKLPLRVEQSYEDYRAWGEPVLTSDGPAAGGQRGSVTECEPRRRRGEPEDSTPPTRRTTTMRIGGEGADVAAEVVSGCSCSSGRCTQIERVVPTSGEVLVQSGHLPPSIFDGGEGLLTAADMEELKRQMKLALPPPWELSAPRLRWGLQGLDLIRFNRVEGLSVGARADLNLGRATMDATARLGIADLSPDVQIGFGRRTMTGDQRLAIYHRLETVQPPSRALGLGNSLGALLFGRDDGFYYRAAGAELLLQPLSTDGVAFALFAEHQRAAAVNTNWALPSLWSSRGFTPNIVADEATQLGFRLGWRGQRGLNPMGRRGTIRLEARAATGSFAYVQPTASVSGSAPLIDGLIGGVEVSAGTTIGDVPAQRLWYLGGPATVRGYEAGAAVGDRFWRGRAEIARAAPGARYIVFGDAGWAGPSSDLPSEPQLLAAGVGVSFLDGLLRTDIARGLRNGRWRLDFHLDAGL